MYIFYLDGVALPVTPSKISTKIKNKNKTINLINDGEINILKNTGLTEISFTATIPYVKYHFSYYPNGFKEATYYLDKIEQLKINKKPFQFICSRTSPAEKLLFDTNITVSLEDYEIEESAENGQSLNVKINLKQYKEYSTKLLNFNINKKTAAVKKTRPVTKKIAKTYKVKKGDCLWNISKKMLGSGSRWKEIYNLNKNKIKNPNLIYPGQVLTLPG